MKILIAIVLILVAFGAGVGCQRYKDRNQIVDISSQWHLTGPNLPNAPPQALDPSGIAIWECPSLVQGQNTTFYEPKNYTEGLSGCHQTGTAKIVLQLQ